MGDFYYDNDYDIFVFTQVWLFGFLYDTAS